MASVDVTPIPDTPAIRRVSFHTLGCKLNQAETDAIAASFREQGWDVVPFRTEADLTFIHTCTVTGEADAKSRQAIRQAVQASPRGKVVAAGCFAQVKPDEVAALDGVAMVLGTREKYRILELLESLNGQPRQAPLVCVGELDSSTFDAVPALSVPSRTRAFLKVQDGCDYACSYCIVPLARGPGRSRKLASCLAEARRLVHAGYREVVLTGVNLGTWEEGGQRFHDLLGEVSQVTGLRRIRISSLEPNLITEEIIQLAAERENIAPHFHVPLQHASDRVLRAMRRRYRFADYEAVVRRIAAALPDAAIGADIMVGFPGETVDDFRQLVDAVTELPLTYHHIFRYSEREGTVAAHLTDSVPPEERRQRSAVLHEISRRRRLEVARRFIGQTRVVHIEHPNGGGTWEGLTDNYLRVRVPMTEPPGDPFLAITITDHDNTNLWGRPAA